MYYYYLLLYSDSCKSPSILTTPYTTTQAKTETPLTLPLLILLHLPIPFHYITFTRRNDYSMLSSYISCVAYARILEQGCHESLPLHKKRWRRPINSAQGFSKVVIVKAHVRQDPLRCIHWTSCPGSTPIGFKSELLPGSLAKVLTFLRSTPYMVFFKLGFLAPIDLSSCFSTVISDKFFNSKPSDLDRSQLPRKVDFCCTFFIVPFIRTTQPSLKLKPACRSVPC